MKAVKEVMCMEQESLFYQDLQDPLASRLRPQSLEDYVGQKHLIGKGGSLPIWLLPWGNENYLEFKDDKDLEEPLVPSFPKDANPS